MTDWKLLTTKDSDEWSKLVESCKQPDIHFTPEYMKIFEEKIGGKAMMFVSYDVTGKNFVLYPFFKRRINDLKIFSSYKEEFFDIISPWYFGGPLLYAEENKIEAINCFLQNFQIFARENNIITGFTRLHPLFGICKDFVNLAEGEYKYDVYYINLKQSENDIWNNFKKSNRNAINAAKRNNIVINFSISDDELKTFFELYNKSMKRIDADDFYFFSFDFFKKIKQNLKDNMIIATALYKEIPISSSLFLFKYGIVHYWLSGSDPRFRNLYPNNLLLYEAIKWSKSSSNETFLLMGGSNKNLRSFKESFSKTKTGFYTINKIYNTQVFSYLNEIRKLTSDGAKEQGFFPYYRIPSLSDLEDKFE